MDSPLRLQVEDFYYYEAELLDERKLRQWLELFTDDIFYWMPIRHNTQERPDDISAELSQPGHGYYFNDDKKSLTLRVERVYSKTAWSELPPSRTRHLITNVRVKADDGNQMARAHGEGRGYVRRHKAGCAAPRRRCLQDRAADDYSRPGRARSEKYQRFFVTLPVGIRQSGYFFCASNILGL